ncbi:MAG: DUF255 domain-containing protein [Planctomycetota bacterium]|nr:MAG: DUF255 domain-containing protein [Planctomycetota bacterium]REK48833.1 MAG: DUF255 domain-containing protein [Planctomycetota bacterium]
MRLDRDTFVITYDVSSVGIDTLITTIKAAGFKSWLATNETPLLASTDAALGKDPAFLTEALARAEQEGKPVVIDFHAEWCLPCKRMLKETFPDPKVASLLRRCIFLKVDTDKHPALARRFGVAGLPDIRLLTPDGSEHRQLTDFQDPTAFAAALNELISVANRE